MRRFAPSDACQNGAALVEFSLVTGRTHQIGVHAAHLGHPLMGDPLYGNPREDLIGRQALHAHRLDLTHPIDGTPLTVESPLPDDLSRLVDALRASSPVMAAGVEGTAGPRRRICQRLAQPQKRGASLPPLSSRLGRGRSPGKTRSGRSPCQIPSAHTRSRGCYGLSDCWITTS